MGQFARRVFVAFVVGFSCVGIVGAGVTAQNAVDAPHPAHIHVGTCEELNPSPEYPLADVAPVSADADLGAVEVSETSVDVSLDDLVASPFAINIHESAGNVSNYIACGDLAGSLVNGALIIGLQEQNDSGYSGVAVLTAGDTGAEVVIYLGHGLAGAEEATAVASPAATDEVTVSIFDYGFEAEMIEIAVGTTVTWINHGQVIHTATENDDLWDSRILDTGESYSYTFEDVGTFEYLCSLHPSMVATVVVTDT